MGKLCQRYLANKRYDMTNKLLKSECIYKKSDKLATTHNGLLTNTSSVESVHMVFFFHKFSFDCLCSESVVKVKSVKMEMEVAVRKEKLKCFNQFMHTMRKEFLFRSEIFFLLYQQKNVLMVFFRKMKGTIISFNGCKNNYSPSQTTS